MHLIRSPNGRDEYVPLTRACSLLVRPSFRWCRFSDIVRNCTQVDCDVRMPCFVLRVYSHKYAIGLGFSQEGGESRLLLYSSETERGNDGPTFVPRAHFVVDLGRNAGFQAR